jgi:hypothetical protein
MKKRTQLVLRSLALLFSWLVMPTLWSQSVQDIVWHGTVVARNGGIFLAYDSLGGQIKWRVSGTTEYESLDEKALFLAKGNKIPVFVAPYNPLRISCSKVTNTISDKQNSEAEKALAKILGVIKEKWEPVSSMVAYSDTNTNYNSLVEAKIESLKSNIEKMKKLDYKEQAPTRSAIIDVRKELDSVQAICAEIIRKGRPITSKIVTLQSSLIQAEVAYNRVSALMEASLPSEWKNCWCLQLADIAVGSDSNTQCKVTYRDAVTDTVIAERTMTIRAYQRFIPEVSGGIGWTDFEYVNYGVHKDSSGNNVVTGTKDRLRNFRLSVALNYLYYVDHSPVLPFLQLAGGVADNLSYSSLLLGAGLRFGVGKTVLLISGGVAAFVSRELNTMQIGDTVTGTDMLEKDLVYNLRIRPYCSIQYPF